jgi:glycosyltransferase involved in cell wall biosynthesis
VTSAPPLVSVLLAAHDAEPYLAVAVRSVLGQTSSDLELLVVDDCSTDATPRILDGIDDDRLVVLRNDEQLGLAASLNRGLDRARGRWVARLDADDAMLPDRLERQLAYVARRRDPAVVGTGVLEIDDAGRLGRLHEPPPGPAAVRWHALFGAPFFHPTVLVDRIVLDRHELRYDPEYLESEDYDLWSRLLGVADGDNLLEPLTLRRVHQRQASRRRADLQRSFQRSVALRGIGALAELEEQDAELAWLTGAGIGLPEGSADAACAAYLALLEAFERRHGRRAEVRAAAARALARTGFFKPALALDRLLPVRVVAARSRRRRRSREALPAAQRVLRSVGAAEGAPLRVTVVSPEPTPYRSPLFDRVAARPELELTVLYAGHTVADRRWDVQPRHRAVFLRGVRVPLVRRLLRHEYPVTPGIFRQLGDSRPDVVVASGWSTFASQAALLWSRARRVPYVLLVSSHDRGARVGWRRAVRRVVLPRVIRGAAGALALGTLARESLVQKGAPRDRIHLFANTVDVVAWTARADVLAARRPELRASLGAGADDVVVLSVGRLSPEKGFEVLLRAAAEAGDRALLVALAGSGPEGAELRRLADVLDVRLVLLGDLDHERLPEAYVAADVFVLLSTWEPWGVVVNEAAACGLPLVLSDQVGAAADLLRDGENGALVPAGDVPAAAAALRRLARDAEARRLEGARSRELVDGWGYEPSVDGFVAAVRAAAAR